MPGIFRPDFARFLRWNIAMSEQFEKGKPLAELHLGPGALDAAMAASPQLTQHVVEHGFAD